MRLSKTIRFGAVRFNLSSAGIGVSAGIPGLRVGTGPRGAYISGGLGAFRYRKSLGTSRTRRAQPEAQARGGPAHGAVPGGAPLGRDAPHAEAATLGRETYDTASVLELSDANSEAILQTIREQRSRVPYWPYLAVASVFVLIALAGLAPRLPSLVYALAAIAAAGGTLWMRWRDKLRRLTVLFYELDVESGARFEVLTKEVREASRASEFTAVTERVAFADKKYHSGADHGVATKPASSSLGFPEYLVSNLSVPMLHAERTTLAFLPDVVLLIQGSNIGAIEYGSLQIECNAINIIRSTPSAPSDATVVGHSWRYPNKNGGPDRRFKDNIELPKCRFSELALTTSTGLNIRLMSSRNEGLHPLSVALSRMTGGGPAHRPTEAEANGNSVAGIFDSKVRSDLVPAVGVGVVAAAILFGLMQVVASSGSKATDDAAPSSSIAQGTSDASLEKLKASADAQPSFDCKKAKSVSERLICSTPELAALDRALAQHYDAVRSAIPESDRKAFASETRRAWQTRESRCRDVACLTDWYQTRGSQLDAWDVRIASAATSSAALSNAGASSNPNSPAQPSKGVATGRDTARADIFQPTGSFCGSPQSDAQRLVCSDVELGAKQLQLDRRYDDDRLRFEAKLPSERYSAFLAESEAASRYRDEQCHEKECLLGWYRGRVEQLAAWEAGAKWPVSEEAQRRSG